MEVIDGPAMETAVLVAPVTALEFLHDAFLLIGEGPVLTVYTIKPRPKSCASLSVLQHYRIHGIRPRSLTQSAATEDESISYDLAVFGGKAVRLLRLVVGLRRGEHHLLHCQTPGPLVELRDWALDVRWLPGGGHRHEGSLLCVAVAHNHVLLLDMDTGNTLARRSCLEGCLLYSALLLVHESWADTVLVGGTVFNQLVLWRPVGTEDAECKSPVERRLLGHSGVIFNISYLAEKGWLASASDDRSVRVWGVGALGGPGGECGDSNPACLRVLYGHQARVFSVRLCPGKVFSAGEDGACLVWDWAQSGKVVRTLKGHRAGGVRALAVSEDTGDGGRWVATGGADGGVRLWKVEERKETGEETPADKLTDLKFPTEVLPKVVRIAEEDTSSRWSQSKFLVCTDQGTVYQYSDGQWEMLWQGPPEFQSYCVMETIAIAVRDSTEKVALCAVGNLSGSIQVFPCCRSQCGILLTGGSGKIHSLIWQKAKDCSYLLASGAKGHVYRWRIEAKSDENGSLALNANPLPPFLLPPCAKRWLMCALPLCFTSDGLLWVCGDRRGSLLLFQEGGKPEQNVEDDTKKMDKNSNRQRIDCEGLRVEENGKGEGMAEREERELCGLTLHPLSCLFGVHGKQGVTSVCEYNGLLYSTGRDGCIRVSRVRLTPLQKAEEDSKKGELELEVLRVQRACKGMEWLEKVLILEPEIPLEEKAIEISCEFESGRKTNNFHLPEKHELEDEKKTENTGREARFVIVGFHAAHFVVWDPVRQERLLAVPCGGGHRSWSLWPSHGGVWPGHGALVFIKQGAVMASAQDTDGKSGSASGGWSLREGIHGRGIGCVCRLGRLEGTGDAMQKTAEERDGLKCEAKDLRRDRGHWEIVVTGGEDTSLTVLALNPDSGRVEVLSVITDHISSVRTLEAVVRHPEGASENQTLSALLVSAGGRAQMQCYRLLIGWQGRRAVPSCQVIQVAAHRLDAQWERRRNRHKTVKMDPETRYMSVAVLDQDADACLLALACSDGALRLFSVSEASCQIDLLWETFHHQRCVLSVATCSLQDGRGNRYTLLFSAATDGSIAVWDLTGAASSLSTDPPPIPSLVIPAHQSGVNSLAVRSGEPGERGDDRTVTVASGGDDGRLTVSTIGVHHPAGGGLSLRLHSQFHTQAHAAPLTSLKLLGSDALVSASSDQRVCLWRLRTTGIGHTGALYSHVADAAGLAAWEGQEDKSKTRRSEGFTEVKARGGEPVAAESETGDPVCKSRQETRGETAGGSINQSECDSSTGKTETGSCQSQQSTDETGWVLVCGQGFQLLRVRYTHGDKRRETI